MIKPSGLLFDELIPEALVVVDLRGHVVEGDLRPSVDTASHLVVYREREDINAIVHSHSPFATSFAVRGESLPIFTTTGAAQFGREIPITEFATIGEEEIGLEIVEKIGESKAILVRGHGVFTVGKNTYDAVKSAVLLEEAAEVTHIALMRGAMDPLSAEVVEAGYRAYRETYGQSPANT